MNMSLFETGGVVGSAAVRSPVASSNYPGLTISSIVPAPGAIGGISYNITKLLPVQINLIYLFITLICIARL